MISNSLITRNIALEPRPSEQVSESYSDELMDDLFGDVDRILAGDRSDRITVVKSQTQTRSPSNRTVQLPSHFVPNSAADIYRATMAASSTSANRPANQPVQTQQVSQGYSKGGRPMSAFQGNPAQSGNFQSAVIQTPTDIPTTTIDIQSINVQPEEHHLCPSDPVSQLTFPLAASPTSSAPPKSKVSKLPISLPFLLIGAAGISLIGTLGIWALSHSGPGSGGLLSFNTEASAAELPKRSDNEFLVYLQQSLDTIGANQTSSNQTVASLPAATSAPTLPAAQSNTAVPTASMLPSLPGATANASNGSTSGSTSNGIASNTSAPNVIERVFVPVYQNERTNNSAAVAPVASAQPEASNQTDRSQATVPVPAPVAAAAALPAGTGAPAVTALPALPGGDAALPPPPATTAIAPANSAAAAIVNTTPVSEQVLVGVLNLGSRSAALFDVEGTSQRAYVGDRIGTSDWSLVSVNGQDVVIRRDGEVRSVYIGQRF